MRGEKLKSLLRDWSFDVIDTDIPFVQQNSLFRSLGFRYKVGPVIKAVNRYILQNLQLDHYDLVWVDKGVYLNQKTMSDLRGRAGKLVHYTPDTAFLGNKSSLFYASVNTYDYVVTTKDFEVSYYKTLVPESKVIATTQGFDSEIHKPLVSFDKKENKVAFAGLCEPSREAVIQELINNKIKVALAGFKWEKFVKENKDNPFLEFEGTALWDVKYSRFISSSLFSIGLLSKRFPEMHTTRTFEIPACGTALLTEQNVETGSFFSEQEVIFYSGVGDLVEKIRYFQNNLEQLEQITLNGYNKVTKEGYDYLNILKRIIDKVFHDAPSLQDRVEKIT